MRKEFSGGQPYWIWSSEQSHTKPLEQSPSHYEVRRFRRSFTLDQTEGLNLNVAVSADSRYKLFINGIVVGRSVGKGDVQRQFYETYDLTNYLRRGTNILSALVLDFSPVTCHPPELGAPCSIISHSGGFILDGAIQDRAGNCLQDLGTDSRWKISIDTSMYFHNRGCPHGGFVGYFEELHVAHAPEKWTEPDFNDSDWHTATQLYPATRLEDYRDAPSPYGLTKTLIPPMKESAPRPFTDIFLPGGAEAPANWKNWLNGQSVTIERNSSIEIMLDAGALQSGFPMLGISGGKNSQITIMYAEGLRLPWSVEDANILGRGLDTSNITCMSSGSEKAGWTLDRRGSLAGWYDEIHPDGRDFIYEPFHWRTFQFVKLTVKTADTPVTLQPLVYRFASYPFEPLYNFQCSARFFEQLNKISWRTFQLCTHETFEDCPYYEQMQYSGDSQITSLLALAATGDARLTKQALYQFSWSLRAEGITECRFPATLPVVIPSWSLHYIFMIADFFDYTGDMETVRDLLPCIRSILDWFDRHKDESGLPAKLPHWNTVDWSPRWDRGQPPGWERGPTCIISSQYLHALRVAAKLEKAAGRKNLYAEEADTIAQKINTLFWNEERGLYEDCPGGPDASQYGNAWAIHAGVATPEKAGRAITAIFENKELDPASFFGIYFMVRALEDAEQYHRFPELLGRWQEMIDGGFSTWAEDIVYWRSLCHAWSAFPTIEFLRGVLGVKPGKPGFEEIVIQPQPLDLQYANGSVPTLKGKVSVEWKIENNEFKLSVNAPAGIPLRIILPSGKTEVTKQGKITLTEKI
ncbi:MAG: hypothetical protein HOO88_06105 [Kiritimatiellaceae bacterium]|nr:hypothetical protein [Kiritimatiellaceae bacterium]